MRCSEKRLLLTGATGLIGKELSEPLLAHGFEVHAITIDEHNPDNGYDWIRGSLFDEEFVHQTMQRVRPEYLLNLAWCTTGDYLTSDLNRRFLAAGKCLAKNFAAVGGKRAVYAGTCFEYRFGDDPIRETDALDSEKNEYTRCKNQLRMSASDVFSAAGIEFAYGRIFYVFGRGESKTRLTGVVLDRLCRGERVTIKTSSLIKDFIYSRDVAGAFAAILDSAVQGPINICTGQPVSVRDLVSEIALRLGRIDQVDFEDIPTDQPPVVLGDNHRLCEEVGFRPTYDLGSAVQEIVQSAAAESTAV